MLCEGLIVLKLPFSEQDCCYLRELMMFTAQNAPEFITEVIQSVTNSVFY